MAMTRTQIYLTLEQHQHIRRLAEAQQKTMAEVIRAAVEAYIARQADNEDALWDIVGLGASTIGDSSAQHDRDLYENTDAWGSCRLSRW